MHTKHIRLVVVALVAIFVPLFSLNAQEVEKPNPTPSPANILKTDAIQIEELSEQAIAYNLEAVFWYKGQKFASVSRVGRLDINYKSDGGATVSASGMTEPIVVRIPSKLPSSMSEKGYTGLIKRLGGKIGVLNPVTGKVVFYD